MSVFRPILAVGSVVLIFGIDQTSAIGQPPDLNEFVKPTAAKRSEREAAVSELTRQIDSHIRANWQQHGVTPTRAASDATLMRRAYLDIVGRIPRVSEVRTFLEDTDPAKRDRLIEKLLASPAYAEHFSQLTREEWLPGTLADNQLRFRAFQVENWLRDRFDENTPYDEVVRRLLLAPLNAPAAVQQANPDYTAAEAYFLALDATPEAAGSSVSRVFLGVKMECAQCHDHPFAPYTREQFWEFAAFFNDIQPGLPRPRPGRQDDYERLRVIRIPNTERIATARHIDGSEPDWQLDQTPRQVFAEWIVTKENPYFARNAVNRVWVHLFGRGIVDPVDEPGSDNPPSHPELLDELTKAFVKQGYDLKFLIQAICRSEAYQLSSQTTHPSQEDPRLFARMPIKGLAAHQLFNAIAIATGHDEDPNQRSGNATINPQLPRGRFLTDFATTERPTEQQRSILQALMMANGDFIDQQTTVNQGRTISAIAHMPFAGPGDRVEALFLATLSRHPRPEERARFTAYVTDGGPAKDPQKALSDVFWALLNTSEFMSNH